MVVNGTAYFQYAELFGTMWPYEWRPWANRVLWDTSGCCNPNTNEFWSLVRALFGYQDQPMNLQLLYYCLFWGMTLGLLALKWRNGSLTDKAEAELAAAKSRKAGGGALAGGEGESGEGEEDVEKGSGGGMGDSPRERQEGAGQQPGKLERKSKDSAESILGGVEAGERDALAADPAVAKV
jgi:hypothetical protein